MEYDPVQHILTRLLVLLSVRVHAIERHDSVPHPTYLITTDDAPRIIGAGGENLKALNYIAKRIVARTLGEAHTLFLIDVNGYQRKRIDAIERQARTLAERARTFKSDVAMPPLNAYERMLVHNMFAHDPDVTTESVGVGKRRHVVFHCQNSLARAETNDSLLVE